MTNRTLVPSALLLLLLAAFSQPAHAAPAGAFRIATEQGEPLWETRVALFRGDAEAKHAGGIQYPYGTEAESNEAFLGYVSTDETGQFGLDFGNYDVRSLIVVAGYVFRPIVIERSDDLSHHFSDHHVRVVVYEAGSTEVVANAIYDLQAKTVNRVPVAGAPEETSFEHVALSAAYLGKLAPRPTALPESKDAELLETFRKGLVLTDLSAVYQALAGGHLTLRAYAATYLGTYGKAESVAYLIDALSDESGHVGANYVDPGQATTRHRAKQALTELTGEDFGFRWNAAADERRAAIRAWKDWLNERNGILDEVLEYAPTQGIDLSTYSVYRAHLNREKTAWSVSFTRDPPRPGAPAVMVDRETLEKTRLRGR